jgi:uncharacterized protein with PIN domain
MACFRIYGELNDFLPPRRRQRPFLHPVRPGGSVKDAIEALGVPHPEIDLILVNGESVGFARAVAAGDRISVFPRFRALGLGTLSRVRPVPPARPRFLLDVHLGRLATFLRLLGFDAAYRNDSDDAELARRSEAEERVLLTQDVGLLKRSRVRHGYRVRSRDPEVQLREVLDRYGLRGEIRPLRRCPRCNGLLVEVAKESVAARLPPHTRAGYERFRECPDCHQLYWQGAHHARLRALIARLSCAPPPDREPPAGAGGADCRNAPGRWRGEPRR